MPATLAEGQIDEHWSRLVLWLLSLAERLNERYAFPYSLE